MKFVKYIAAWINEGRDDRDRKRAAELRSSIMLEIADPKSMVAVAFAVEVNREVEKRLRVILIGRRIAHCYVCLSSDQLRRVGDGIMACSKHAVVKS